MAIYEDSDKGITPQLSRQAANALFWVQFYWWICNIRIIESTIANLDRYLRLCKIFFSYEGALAGRPKKVLPSKNFVKG